MLRFFLTEKYKTGMGERPVFLIPDNPSEWLPRWLSSKESTCSAGDAGLIPGLGRSPEGGHGILLQYCCLKNPMDRGAWQATVHGVAKELDMTERRNTHTQSVSRSTVKTSGYTPLFPGPYSQRKSLFNFLWFISEKLVLWHRQLKLAESSSVPFQAWISTSPPNLSPKLLC